MNFHLAWTYLIDEVGLGMSHVAVSALFFYLSLVAGLMPNRCRKKNFSSQFDGPSFTLKVQR